MVETSFMSDEAFMFSKAESNAYSAASANRASHRSLPSDMFEPLDRYFQYRSCCSTLVAFVPSMVVPSDSVKLSPVAASRSWTMVGVMEMTPLTDCSVFSW